MGIKSYIERRKKEEEMQIQLMHRINIEVKEIDALESMTDKEKFDYRTQNIDEYFGIDPICFATVLNQEYKSEDYKIYLLDLYTEYWKRKAKDRCQRETTNRMIRDKVNEYYEEGSYYKAATYLL